MMSDAPERIWASQFDGLRHFKCSYVCEDFVQVEYIRADLAGLPESLVKRLREKELDDGYLLTALERDILAWHEQQKGGGK